MNQDIKDFIRGTVIIVILIILISTVSKIIPIILIELGIGR